MMQFFHIIVRVKTNKVFLRSKYMASNRISYNISGDHLVALFDYVNTHLTLMESAGFIKYEQTEPKKRIALPQIQKSIEEYLERFLPAIEQVTTKLIGEICPICYQCYLPNEKCRKLHCQHVYHANCIETWFERNLDNLSCPMCRTSQYND